MTTIHTATARKGFRRPLPLPTKHNLIFRGPPQQRHQRRVSAAVAVATVAAGFSTFAPLPTAAAVLSTGMAETNSTGINDTGDANSFFGGVICADVTGGVLSRLTSVQTWDCNA